MRRRESLEALADSLKRFSDKKSWKLIVHLLKITMHCFDDNHCLSILCAKHLKLREMGV